MNDIDEFAQLKKDIGQRFKFFREVLALSKQRMEIEVRNDLTAQEQISLIENGTILPDILLILYCFELYGLNFNWLITGVGRMFYKKGIRTNTDIYNLSRENDIDNPRFCSLALLYRKIPWI